MDSISLFFFILLFAIASAECPRGWLHYEQKCYLFSHDVMSWYDASYLCEVHHAKLAIVESPEENDFLQLEAQARKGSFWLGGADDVVEDDWRWVASEVQFNFTDWGPKQPDDAGKNEDCLLLYEGGHWKWYDLSCNSRVPKFICERDYPGYETVVG